MEIQQASVKLFVKDPAGIDLDACVPIFHRWIQEHRIPGFLLIDVADYRHVAGGPGIMLIAHQAHYALDGAGGSLGLVFNRKRDPVGPAAAKLQEALDRCWEAARFLKNEAAFQGKLAFATDRLQIGVVSRLVAPSSTENRALLAGSVREVLTRAYPGREIGLTPHADADPRAPLGFLARLTERAPS